MTNTMTTEPKRTNWWMWAALILSALFAVSALKCRHAYEELSGHEDRDHDERALWHNQTLRKDREIALQDTIIKTVNAWADSINHAKDSVIQAMEGTIKRLAGRRLPVQAILDADSLELTKYQLENRDSTIDEQFGVIGELKAKISIADSADRIEDAAYIRKISAYNAYSRRVGMQRDSLLIRNEKLDRKWRRKRRLERIGEAAVVVGILILAL